MFIREDVLLDDNIDPYLLVLLVSLFYFYPHSLRRDNLKRPLVYYRLKEVREVLEKNMYFTKPRGGREESLTPGIFSTHRVVTDG
jgi:hypothetical protein